MSKRARVAPAIIVLLLIIFVPTNLWAQDNNGVDAVGAADLVATIPLSDTLYTWGRLGGMTVDRLGFIYISNFADAVWRVTPEGKVTLLTNSLYGASGNAIDSRGNLLQSNFFANTISRISRPGDVATYVSEGLKGPVGIAVDKEDNLYVCNCSGNNIAKVDSDGTVTEFAKSDLFRCPNGVAFDKEGNLFVVNFSNEHVVKIAADGVTSKFATVPGGGGNAHIVFTRGSFYVSKIRTNQVFRVTPEGKVSLTAGTGQLGLADGPGPQATFRRPNGIAVSPNGRTLYLNNISGAWGGGELSSLVIRKITLASLSDIVLNRIKTSGIEAAVSAYHKYKKDPTHQSENTEREINQLSYRLLRESQLSAAIAVFKLNAESYPNSWNVHDSLGETLMIAGKREQAAKSYERSLELNPNNKNAKAKLEELVK